jgi:GH24 family phage-related lysozyme (muramidase)
LGLTSFNHLGNALDIQFKKNNTICEDGVVQQLREDIFIKRLNAKMGWGNRFRFAMETCAQGARRWVHIDMRDAIAPWNDSRYYALTNGAIDGAALVELARQESRFKLLNCNGIPKDSPSTTTQSTATIGAPQAENTTPVPIATANKSPAPAPSALPPSNERRPAKQLDLSTEGLNFIKDWEDYREYPYEDARHYCTVGYGHLIAPKKCSQLANENDALYLTFKSGLKPAAAAELLRKDVSDAVKSVRLVVQVPLYQHEFDALVSLAFNTNGIAKFPNLMAKLNTSNYSGCCDEFADITNKGIPGLVKRRKAEMLMFRNNKYDSKH